MPIEIATLIRVLDQDEFHALDKRVMAVVFAVHNEFGRLLDQSVYKQAIASRCAVRGLEPVEQEVRIRVTHETFTKDYFMDLLFGHGMMLEAKTAETIMPAHRAQSLNYILLAGIRHARLVNLRPGRVQHEYVSTTLHAAQRRRFLVVDSEWREPNQASAWLRAKVIELLQDWGAFLEISLYRSALVHLLKGPSVTRQDVEILDGRRVLGRQPACLLTGDTALSCTALTRGLDQMGGHLRRFLAHTPLRFVQWVNLNRARIEFRTLSR
jgi:GxxExxY protein